MTTPAAPDALSTPVVVGHDGHPHAERVVDAAVEEAERSGAALLLLALVPVVDDPDHTVRAQRRHETYAVERATHRLGESLGRLRSTRPDVPMDARVLLDPEESDVAEALSGCRLLVLGSHGPGHRPAFAMDTTSQRLLRAAACPVLVVPVHVPRASGPADRRVVAGVGDDHDEGVRIINAAIAAAAPSGRVTVVHSYRRHDGETAESARVRAERTYGEMLAMVPPGTVTVNRVLTVEPAARVLAEQAHAASMLVIGSRGPLALAGMSWDSVSRGVLESLDCPVLIVPRTPRQVGGGGPPDSGPLAPPTTPARA